MSLELADYAESISQATSLEAAFSAFENQVQRLGFDGALYTYIPDIILQTDDGERPVYQVSETYVPDYLTHYQDARYDRNDPLIKAVTDGVSSPIDWHGNTCQRYMAGDHRSREVIEESRHYGVRRGITLPLKSDADGIAGASFIMTEHCPDDRIEQQLKDLQMVTRIYHHLVIANTGYVGNFVQPVFGHLNDLEIRFLAGLARGHSLKELAGELHRSHKYLEQVLLRIRAKVGGVDEDGRPLINRDQLMYYTGLVNIISLATRLP